VWFFIAERAPRARLAEALRKLASDGPAAAGAVLAGARSMEAEVARRCLAHAGDGVAAVESRKAAAIEDERLRYEQRIAFLGTLGNNAPFVGLFGTVLGVIKAFDDLKQATTGSETAVMAGIAEALTATAIGLLVAIPAVVAYNYFSRRLKVVMGGADEMAHAVLAAAHARAKEQA